MLYSTLYLIYDRWSISPSFWVLCLCVVVVCYLKGRKKDFLDDIPGPIVAKWSPLWLAYHARRGQRYKEVDSYHKTHGPFVRISPNHISVSHKDAIGIIYAQGDQALDKSSFYDAFVSHKPSVFSTTDRQDHARKRKLVSHPFSYQSLQDFVPSLHTHIGVLIQRLDEMCEKNRPANILPFFHYLAFDILSDLAFGESIGMLDKGSDLVSVKLSEDLSSEAYAISVVDNREHFAAVVGLHPLLRPLSKLVPDPFFIRGRKDSVTLEVLARECVMKRLDSGIERNDILSKLIQARLQNDIELGNEEVEELAAETVTLLIAGSDTTSNSVAAILYFILMHGRVHEKLLGELENTISSDELPTYDNIKGIRYLEACINEGLRLHATTAIGLPRVVKQGGVMCCGKFFPEGTEMSVPSWTIQHDPEIWGDPDTYRPERWLGADSKDLHKYLLAFGKGPRACLGRNLAYMEMSLILATVLIRYNISLSDSILKTTEGFMHKPVSLVVNLRRRKGTLTL